MLGLGVASNSGLSSDSASMSRQAAFANTKSLDFDGTNDYVNTNYTLSTLFRGSFSFSYWVNLDAGIAVSVGVEKGTHSSFAIQHFNGNINVLHYSNSDIAFPGTSSTPISLDTWHHVVVTVTKNSGSATTYAIYVDNNLISYALLAGFTISESNHESFNASGEFLAIGASNDDGTPDTFVNGNMDEVAIFSEALSSSEVTAIYNSGVPKDESGHDNLLLYYRFEDDVTDTTGTSNATNNGATFSSTVPS
tara:strand:- start:376 stop:1125 length:750 start_codon:yes stop_codon:yes gene_type:complete